MYCVTSIDGYEDLAFRVLLGVKVMVRVMVKVMPMMTVIVTPRIVGWDRSSSLRLLPRRRRSLNANSLRKR